MLAFLAALAVGILLAASAAHGAEGVSPHGELSLECSACHTAEGWTPLRETLDFDHAATGFALELAHRRTDCMSCHESPVFSFVGTFCSDCHRDPHRGELGFGCERCHSAASWDNRREMFDRHDLGLFPLTGVHRVTDCESCHRETSPFEFAQAPLDCFACHLEDYRTAGDPDHQAAGFPTECETCHTTQGWQGALFGGLSHDVLFPLRGAHAAIGCSDCHTSGFAGTPTDCFACHRDDYLGTRNPDHQAAGFPTNCELCHGTSQWEGATEVSHDQFFVLEGVHRVLDCEECHAAGFAGTPTDCFSCHAEAYRQTTDPDHAAAGFGTSCELCHDASSWGGASFDHDQFFVLTGSHRGLDCEACHAAGFAGTPTDCYSCHADRYEGTDEPNHVAAGFPTMCELCHGTSSWEGATFDHGQFWALTGAHRGLDCESCHATQFAGTPTDCYSCHAQDYRQTTDPDHQAAGFPTTCEDCHGTSSWEGATFDHDGLYFPIYSGKHAGEWGDCSDCHVVASDFGVFECINCHEHSKAKMDDEHSDVGGYVYESTACYSCHPDGSE